MTAALLISVVPVAFGFGWGAAMKLLLISNYRGLPMFGACSVFSVLCMLFFAASKMSAVDPRNAFMVGACTLGLTLGAWVLGARAVTRRKVQR